MCFNKKINQKTQKTIQNDSNPVDISSKKISLFKKMKGLHFKGFLNHVIENVKIKKV